MAEDSVQQPAIRRVSRSIFQAGLLYGLSLNAVATSYWGDTPHAMIDRLDPRAAPQMDRADRRRPLLAALQRLLLWRFVTLPTATIGAAGAAPAHSGPAALFLR